MEGNEVSRSLFHGFKSHCSLFYPTFGRFGVTDRPMVLPNSTHSFIWNIGTLNPNLLHVYLSEVLLERGTVDESGFVFVYEVRNCFYSECI